MTHTRFRKLVADMFAGEREGDEGISAFARWLPCDPRQARRYALDETPVPAGIARLLELMAERGIKPEKVPEA